MCDALAVDTPIWVLGDSAYDILDWHDYLLAAGSCQSTRETVTNTNAFFPSLPSLQSLLKQGGSALPHQLKLISRSSVWGSKLSIHALITPIGIR